MPSSLYVVIPVFNRWDQTERCLRSIESSSHLDIRVVVVNHGSTDSTAAKLTTEFPAVVHLLETDQLWWTGATNVGIRYAIEQGAERVALLNADCVVEPHMFERLIHHSDSLPGSVIAPVQRSADTGAVLSSGALPMIGLGFPTLLTRRTVSTEPKAEAVALIVGGRGVLIPADVFARVGLFDEVHLPHYLADHDFYLRCVRAGIALRVAHDANVLVDNDRSSSAADLMTMSWPEFKASLIEPRSHRNVSTLRAFFAKHYPIRRVAFLGVWLNLARFFSVWLARRSAWLAMSTLQQRTGRSDADRRTLD